MKKKKEELREKIAQLINQIGDLKDELSKLKQDYEELDFDKDKYIGKYFYYDDPYGEELLLIYCKSVNILTDRNAISLNGVGIICDNYLQNYNLYYDENMQGNGNFDFTMDELQYLHEITREEYIEKFRQHVNKYIDNFAHSHKIF